ncbi:MAG: hypothetical protein L6Q55_15515 [Azonexus sp.]|nr:hypothetical protein [Azonexus sp.]MCK6413811.1 hypothetical protein [Azonexus sp.]
MSSVTELRQCFLGGLPDESQAEHDMPKPAQIYMPPAHRRALSLDAPLVVGGRGAGKTLWLRALKDKSYRELLAKAFEFPDFASIEVKIGFSTESSENVPDSRTLNDLLRNQCDAYNIWSAVILHAFVPGHFALQSTWGARTRWVADNGEAVSNLLRSVDSEAAQSAENKLLLFDGLDTTAPRSWEDTQVLLKGLLMLTHQFRQYRALRLKLFIRPDMLERRSIAFPDSSKLINNALKLEWKDIDLYGLLFQYLGNADQGGQVFRDFTVATIRTQWSGTQNSFPLPKPLREDGEMQQRLFHALAGKSMGGGSQRGDTWKWVPNHLSDASGYVSPRSFISALRNAAKNSGERDPSGKAKTALIWQAIQTGVAKASAIRVRELQEDYPWIDDAIAPLKGLLVPCEIKEILRKWTDHETLSKVLNGRGNHRNTERLPPVDVSQNDPKSLIEAMRSLNVFSYRKDGRVDVPDIIRVEAGMTRRGGVPVRR